MRRIFFLLVAASAAIAPAQFSLTLNKSVVAGQNYVQGTITMDSVAPTDTAFTTYDNSSLLTTPATVTVFGGTTSRVFGIQTTAVNSNIVTTVYAKRLAVTKSQVLTLAPLVPTALAFTPNPVSGGITVLGRVVINGIAGPGGRTIALFDNSAYSETPSTVIVPPGGTDATFAITTLPTLIQRTVTVTARVSAGAKQGTFRILPSTGNESKIVFNSTINGVYGIYSVNPDGTNITPLLTGDTEAGSPAWSRTHHKIAFHSTRAGSGYKIWTMNPDGSGLQQITNTAGRQDLEPAWAPNNKLAYSSIIQEWNYNELFFDNIRLTTDQNTINPGPSLSPDGTKILYSRNELSTGPELYTMNVNGTGEVQITFGLKAGNPAWSPDGQWILFTDGTAQHVISRIRPNGTDKQSLGIYGQEMCWSPNGSQIAYTGHDGDSYEIYVANADGSNPVKITDTFASGNPTWY